jgi:Na+-transporting methylmalonyl-CoA/oxaloacetate decarboxylase gamma subunit
MAENLTEAAVITVVGVLVVFVSLAVLMVSIIVLSRLTTSRKSVQAKEAAPPIMEEGGDQGDERGLSNEAIAAIAVSLARTMDEARPVRRPPPERLAATPAGSSPWARAGREQLMRSRGKVGHQWGKPSR